MRGGLTVPVAGPLTLSAAARGARCGAGFRPKPQTTLWSFRPSFLLGLGGL